MEALLRRWAEENGLVGQAADELVLLLEELSTRGPRSAPLASSSESALPVRYEDLGRVARGGSAEVRRVRDRTMKREVVMKILGWENLDSASSLGRFLNEARMTGYLDHPGVVPVHDRGVLADGRPWFTMKEVRGATLAAQLDGASRHDPLQRRRLVDALARACDALGYAHHLGITHRDIKPANLMLGTFGEVYVLDWGIARETGEDGAARSPTPLSPSSDWTQTGEIWGTPAYMSPEQARGAAAEVGPRSDVWSVGMVLFEILTGRRAMEGAAPSAWVKIIEGVAPAIPREASVPDELEAVYRSTVHPTASMRLADGAAVASALRSWLDGDAKRARARSLVQQARGLEASLEILAEREAAARAEAVKLRAEIRSFDPEDRKRTLWACEDRAASLLEERALLEAEQTERLRAALEHDPDCEEAHAALADHHRQAVVAAEADGRHADAIRHERMLRRHDRGQHRTFLEGLGSLSLETDAPARVVAHRYERRDRRLRPGAPIDLGRAPILARELAAGSYLIELRPEDPSLATVRYPVRVPRDGEWRAASPGATELTPIHLPPTRALGEQDIYVAAGWCSVGGDEHAAEPVPRQTLWVPGFAMRRHPVTFAEYLAFLDDVLATRGEEEATRFAPRVARGATAGPPPLAVVRERDRFVPGADAEGRTPGARWPVAGVDWYSARAYAEWESAKTGAPWRLPSELEWEKAARGTDGRFYPWGDEPEATWARILGSTEGAPSRANVEDDPLDESPYGVRGLAGNVRDWCLEVWEVDGPPVQGGVLRIETPPDDDLRLRAIRGGAWQTVPAFARAAGRFAAAPDDRYAVLGFRLARSVGGPLTDSTRG
ncbi:MAG: SUMF1/EgtB/PvdO family nonheme iron enzyme [Sandaracinaceae bacterium]